MQMNWRMDFEWYELSEEDRAKKPDIWAPHATPVMAGGLFAIRKDYFESIGYYDEGDLFFHGDNGLKNQRKINLNVFLKEWKCGAVRTWNWASGLGCAVAELRYLPVLVSGMSSEVGPRTRLAQRKSTTTSSELPRSGWTSLNISTTIGKIHFNIWGRPWITSWS